MVDDKTKLIDLRHPEYTDYETRWKKWRLCYEGGTAFIDEYLKRYSKREDDEDFKARKEISYAPSHAKQALRMIRDALAAKMPEVSRKGDPRYLAACASDIDGYRSSMSTFLMTEVAPLLFSQFKRYVMVDAPPAATEARTKADELGRKPYVFAIGAEDVLSWTYADGVSQATINGIAMQVRGFTAVLIKEKIEVTDPESGLVRGTETRYKHMKLVSGQGGESGVQIDYYNDKGEPLANAEGSAALITSLPITRIPLVEFRLAESLMTDIADMQIAAMALASTDMSALYRCNFPIFTKQVTAAGAISIGNRAANVRSTRTENTLGGNESSSKSGVALEAGAGKGMTYQEGTERPGWVSYPSESVKISMEKQAELKHDIRNLASLSLTSLSVSALQQSGASKEADRIGEEAGLAYIATVLEAGERELAQIYHEFLGVETAQVDVKYPIGYSLRTPDDRRKEATELNALKGAVRSPLYQKAIAKRIVETLLRTTAGADEIAKITAEVDGQLPVDEDIERAKMYQADKAAGFLSAATGAKLRGYGEAEADIVAAESQLAVERLTGGPDTITKEDEEVKDEEQQDDGGAKPQFPLKATDDKPEQKDA